MSHFFSFLSYLLEDGLHELLPVGQMENVLSYEDNLLVFELPRIPQKYLQLNLNDKNNKIGIKFHVTVK